MFDPSRLFDATNTPGFLQQYGRQSLPAGDLPLRSFDQYWQSEDEISDTEIEDGEYDADENGASSEDKSADGSSEVLTDPMDEGGKMEWKRPRFGLTKNVRRMFDKHGNAVGIEIECGFNKDLGHVESQPPYYVQYRRNYFNIKAKYLVITRSQDTYDRLYLPDLVTGLSRIVVALVMSIRGVIGDEDGPAAELRVFTPKRKDIGTPTSVRVRPSNGEEPGDPILYEYTTGHFDKERVRHQEVFFQRHQFRKATPNNGCRRREQQFHRVVVEVNAIVGTPETHDQQEITVASVASDLLVTRGRCPKSSEPYDKTNPHHSRRKPQTPDDRRKKKLKERATNEKKDSGRVRKVESSEAPLSGRTRSQWRNIAAHPTASPTVPTLTNDASSRTSTVARSSPELANRTQEHPYVPGHHQAMLGLGSIGQLPPLKEWTDPFEGDDHGDLFNGTAGSTEALHAEYQGSQRSSVEQLMMLSHSSLANTGNATAATGDPALNDRVDYTGLSLEAFQRYPQIYRRQQ